MAKAAEAFVCVKLDVDQNKQVSQKFKVRFIPDLRLVYPDGSNLEAMEAREPAAIVKALERFRSKYEESKAKSEGEGKGDGGGEEKPLPPSAKEGGEKEGGRGPEPDSREAKLAKKAAILKTVRERLERETAAILREIEQTVDRELGLAEASGAGAPAKEGKPAASGGPGEGERKPGYLGIRLDEVSAEVREYLSLGEGVGVTVTEVMEGTPAAEAGLRDHDIIVAINGKDVGPDTLPEIVGALAAGDKAEVTYYRKGQKQTAVATLGARPEE